MVAHSAHASSSACSCVRTAIRCGGNGGGDVAEAVSLGWRFEGAVANGCGDLLVRVAERDAVAHERLCGVRREQKRIRRGRREAVAVEDDALDENRERSER